MKSQHALECRITRARPSSTRLGERLATIHRASQEELFDLVGHLGRPDANSRRISRQLLVRLDAMDGVTLYGWMAKLSQIQCLYRTRNGNAVDQTVGRWIDEVLGRVATRVGGIWAGPDTRLAKELLARVST